MEPESRTLELIAALLSAAIVFLIVGGFILRSKYLREIAFLKRSRNRWKKTCLTFSPDGEMLDDEPGIPPRQESR